MCFEWCKKNRIILRWGSVFADEKLKYLEDVNVNLESKQIKILIHHCFSYFELSKNDYKCYMK